MADIRLRFDIRITRKGLLWGAAGLLLCVLALETGSESFTLSTSYPAPSGIYNRLITTGPAYLARNGGNVGIATTNPGYTLDVQGAVNAADFYKNGSPFAASPWINSANGIYYDAGNVGIGTTSPANLLAVGANGRFQVGSSGNLAEINGVGYSWPGSNSSGVLTNDGSGVLSWAALPTPSAPCPRPVTVVKSVAGAGTSAYRGGCQGTPRCSGTLIFINSSWTSCSYICVTYATVCGP